MHWNQFINVHLTSARALIGLADHHLELGWLLFDLRDVEVKMHYGAVLLEELDEVLNKRDKAPDG